MQESDKSSFRGRCGPLRKEAFGLEKGGKRQRVGKGASAAGGQGEAAERWKIRLIEQVCDYIRSNASGDMSLGGLEKKFGISRYRLQRAFSEVMGISPRKYAEECRILLLKRHLRWGRKVPSAIYSSGYGSQSWLYSSHSSKLGMTPASYRKGGEGATISYGTATSSFGLIMVAETEHGVCSLNVGGSEGELETSLRSEFPAAVIVKSDSVMETLRSVLGYFDGQRLRIPLDVDGTEFQRRVWSAVMMIPYGRTASYIDIAAFLGSPGASRAVANACASNPVPLIIPCHRVVRADGRPGGYSLGIDRKLKLLQLEKEGLFGK